MQCQEKRDPIFLGPLEADDPRPEIGDRIWKVGSRTTHEHQRGRNLKAMCKGCHRLWIKVPFDEQLRQHHEDDFFF